MTEKKRREKVTAEITLAHLTQFAVEAGGSLSPEEAIAFLNQNGRAYAMWKHMMQAGEEYFKSTMQHQEQTTLRMVRPTRESRRAAV